ncbi:uncharacterized protein SPSK_02954 [Sporothrix schenckii 1099-18]|uniref:Uncharacterized protein n=1 Tax=Sporothrix schenckii 1099-18 TaxID=1397361 RepID=A0A0F2LY15_SPOSC|nr:uncharacterized protein SPSK_02954 [Sporothrix schenckii 1099-18]KJR82362.1 hypothetical protein SPSK_02954 [Sporothrix schenckii 1099-18]
MHARDGRGQHNRLRAGRDALFRAHWQRVLVNGQTQQAAQHDDGAGLAHDHVGLVAVGRCNALETAARGRQRVASIVQAAGTALDARQGLLQQQVDKVKGLGRDARAAGAALGIVEREPRGALALGDRAVLELLQAALAFGAHVAGHADDKVGQQTQHRVLGGVDRGGHVQAPPLEHGQARRGHVHPGAAAVADHRRVVHLHGIQDALAAVDFEVAKDVRARRVRAVARRRTPLANPPDRLRLNGVDVGEVALLCRPVHAHALHARHALVRAELAHQVRRALVQEDGAVVEGKRGARRLQLFQHNGWVVANVHNGKVVVLGVADRHQLPRLRAEVVVAVEAVHLVAHEALRTERRQPRAKVLLVVRGADRHLVRGALHVALAHQHVGEVDLQRAVRLVKQHVRVLHVVLVRRKRVADQNRQRVAPPPPPRAPALLSQVGDAVGEAPRHDAVERANVDAQLQRRRRYDAHQAARKHVCLDASPVALVASAPLQFLLDGAYELLALFAHAAKGNHAHAAQDQLAEQPRAFIERAAAAAGRIARHAKGRVPAEKLFSARRRAVIVDELYGRRLLRVVALPVHDAKDGLKVLPRVGHCGRARDEAHRAVAESGAHAPQPAHDEGHVRAHEAVVVVQLVDHDIPQPLQERAPAALLRQNGGVQHVGVREDDARLLANAVALFPRRIAVVRLHENVAQVRHVCQEVAQAALLVLGERLGWEDVHGARERVIFECMDHRQLEDERLARARRRRHHDVAARVQRVNGLGLVHIELRDAFGVVQRVDHVLAQQKIQVAVHGLLLFEHAVAVRDHLSRVPRAVLQLVHNLGDRLPFRRNRRRDSVVAVVVAVCVAVVSRRPRVNKTLFGARYGYKRLGFAFQRLDRVGRISLALQSLAPVQKCIHGRRKPSVALFDERSHLLLSVHGHPQLLVPQHACRLCRLTCLRVSNLPLEALVDKLEIQDLFVQRLVLRALFVVDASVWPHLHCLSTCDAAHRRVGCRARGFQIVPGPARRTRLEGGVTFCTLDVDLQRQLVHIGKADRAGGVSRTAAVVEVQRQERRHGGHVALEQRTARVGLDGRLDRRKRRQQVLARAADGVHQVQGAVRLFQVTEPLGPGIDLARGGAFVRLSLGIVTVLLLCRRLPLRRGLAFRRWFCRTASVAVDTAGCGGILGHWGTRISRHSTRRIGSLSLATWSVRCVCFALYFGENRSTSRSVSSSAAATTVRCHRVGHCMLGTSKTSSIGLLVSVGWEGVATVGRC